MPTWANPADASSRNKPINNWYTSLRPQSPRLFMPLRNWICSVNRCRPRRIQPVNVCEHSNLRGSSTAREQVLPVVKMKPRKPASEAGFLRLAKVETVDDAKRQRIKEMRLWTGLAPIPISLLRDGVVFRRFGPLLVFAKVNLLLER